MSDSNNSNSVYTPRRNRRFNKALLNSLPNNFKLDNNITIPWTERQLELIDKLTRKRSYDIEGKPIPVTCAFISGVAGTSKTTIAVYSALRLLFEGKVSQILYVRSAVDSSPNKLGYLKGGLEEKLGVYQTPLDDKLNELLPRAVVNVLMENEYVKMESTCFLRGRNLADCVVIVDESQNLQHEELVTIISRMAEHSRIWFCYDEKQSDLSTKHKTDMQNFADIFNTEECVQHGFHHHHFDHTDIVRSRFCRFVMDKIEEWEDSKVREQEEYEKRRKIVLNEVTVSYD